ncbi:MULTISPECIES: TetR/AcrR family transcriptional regulator [unclassified Frondihabitans]|uniref:TetR/AcrR family transcriptional regulator n=1 Tax=unclassified Frondihabitans TaxID=2626248 RepID=UPI000F4FDD1A|nr:MULTISPECIES: TetR/AcrR family transcriptional regulator [unclassified Frondihabitans]RPE77803.1 TetR family transcriptional regulator [Frondihabitans sp. PhB153]RPF08082.1 TetR family transcriptional regulator [Frondihabitans sp. PhB161]
MADAKVGNMRGPYAKTAAVRARIIEACTGVFAESGYRATTMKEIAERAEISQRGLVHHFGSKEELLAAVIEAREAELAPVMAPLGDAIGSFVSMLAVLAHDSERPGLIELNSLLVAEGASSEHPAHEHYQERYDGLRHYFATAFDQLRESGDLNSELDSSSLASGFVGLLEGLQVQWLYNPDAIRIDVILRAFLEAVIPDFALLSKKAVAFPA